DRLLDRLWRQATVLERGCAVREHGRACLWGVRNPRHEEYQPIVGALLRFHAPVGPESIGEVLGFLDCCLCGRGFPDVDQGWYTGALEELGVPGERVSLVFREHPGCVVEVGEVLRALVRRFLACGQDRRDTRGKDGQDQERKDATHHEVTARDWSGREVGWKACQARLVTMPITLPIATTSPNRIGR